MITTNLEYKIEKTKDNYEVLKIEKDNKWIYVGSKYNMKGSVDKFLEEICTGKDLEKKIFFVFGFGTGEHIKTLCDKFKKNRIIVFEPNEALKNYIPELKWITKYRNLTVLCSEENHLKDFIKNELEDFKTDRIQIGYFANYHQIYAAEFSGLIELIKKTIWDMQIEINTSMSYSKRWFDTFVSNFEFMLQGVPSTVYKDKYKGRPAIIVSAGPSLEKNIEELKKIKDDFLILVGGRTLRSVLDQNIKPSIMVNVDPSERNYQLVKGYIEDTNIPLLFYEGTNEKIVSNHDGKKIFFTQKDFIKKMAEVEIENYTFGGSVAHIATGFATDIGCNPIIFIGQDLAYTNDKMYSKISSDQNNPNTEEPNSVGNIMVDAVNGGQLRTEPVLYGFKKNLENYISAKKQTTLFINATEGGARIEGTIEMPLKEVIENYCGNKIIPFDELDIDYKVDIKKNAKNMIEDVKKSCNSIISYCEKACKNIEDLKEHYDSKKSTKINRTLLKLDKIDEKIKIEYTKLEITETLLYPLIFDAMTSKFDIDHHEGTEEDKINTIIKNNTRLYLNLSANLKYVLKSIDNLLMDLNGESELENLIKGLNLEI